MNRLKNADARGAAEFMPARAIARIGVALRQALRFPVTPPMVKNS
jgi:hypothetical protein